MRSIDQIQTATPLSDEIVVAAINRGLSPAKVCTIFASREMSMRRVDEQHLIVQLVRRWCTDVYARQMISERARR